MLELKAQAILGQKAICNENNKWKMREFLLFVIIYIFGVFDNKHYVSPQGIMI